MPDDAIIKMSKKIRNVHLIADQGTDVQGLAERLPAGAELFIHGAAQAPERSPALANALLLIDCASISWDQSLNLLETLQNQMPHSQVALLGVEETQSVSAALKWPVLAGIFTDAMGPELLEKGLEELLAGRFWFSREQMNLMASFRQTPKVPTQKPSEALSPREMEVLDLTSQGKSNADIANELFLSQHTVKTHLYNLYRKLGVVNRTQAVHWYQENH